MKQQRPKFDTMWKHFSTVNVNVPTVGKIIGGKVQQNIEIALKDPRYGFENACAIRMSYSLHQAGVIIAQGAWEAVSGGGQKSLYFSCCRYENIFGGDIWQARQNGIEPSRSRFCGYERHSCLYQAI